MSIARTTPMPTRPPRPSAQAVLALAILLAAQLFPMGRALAAGAPAGDPAPAAIAVQPNVTPLDDVEEAAFSPDGTLLAVNERKRIRLWQIATRRPLRTFEHPAYFEHFTFLDEGRRILSVHKDGFVRTWDTATGALAGESAIPGFEPGTSIVAFHYDARRNLAVIVEVAGRIMLWSLDKKRIVYQAKHEFEVSGDINLSSDGRQLIVPTAKAVIAIDWEKKTETRHPLAASEGGTLAAGDRLLRKTNGKDCAADLVLVDYRAGGTQTRIDPAPGCRPTPDSETDDGFGQLSVRPDAGGAVLAVARSGRDGIRLLDLAGAQPPRIIARPFGDNETLIAADLATGLAASLADGRITVIGLSDGRTLATLRSFGPRPQLTFAAADRKSLVLSTYDDKRHPLVSWPVAGGTPSAVALPDIADQRLADVATGPKLALATDGKSTLTLHSLATGGMIARFVLSRLADIDHAHLSPDGARILVVGNPLRADRSDGEGRTEVALLLDGRTGRELKVIATHSALRRGARVPQGYEDLPGVTSSIFSADGKRFAIGFRDSVVEIWDAQTGRFVRQCDHGDDMTTSLQFSVDGRLLVGGSRDSGIFIWETGTGRLLRTLTRDVVAGHVSTAGLALSPDNTLLAAGPHQRAVSSGDVGADSRIQVWEVATGKRRFLLRGHESDVNTILFTDDGRWIVSGGVDGSIRYWDRRSGRLGATFTLAENGRWVIVTDKGFFAASGPDASDLLAVVRRVEATSIDQIWQSLYAPDLVRERLRDDPDGEYETAAANADLSTILDSGPAPTVALAAPSGDGTQDLVTLEATVTDAGKGIGRIEWRVNGITVAVLGRPPEPGPTAVSRQRIALDPGDNEVEVVAYTANDFLASTPARVKVAFTGREAAIKPRLHVLAIGINAYEDRGSLTPSTGQTVRFKPLRLAVRDAEALAQAVGQASAGLYDGEPGIVVLRDGEATRAGIVAAIDRMAPTIGPHDTFILFAAAHGTTKGNRFYLIPQDYDGGTHPVWLEQRAIGQGLLQDWLANRIRAKKALVLLDTCESGALIAGYLRPRSEDSASEAGIGRLYEATGRPILTAAASGQFAYEGVVGDRGERHGVFTFALIDALHHAEANARGEIRLSTLVAYVQDAVPRLALARGGLAEGRAAAGVPGADKRLALGAQSARFGSRGEDFSLLRKLP